MNEVAKLNEKSVTKEFYEELYGKKPIIHREAYEANDLNCINGFQLVEVTDTEGGVDLIFRNNHYVEAVISWDGSSLLISELYSVAKDGKAII